MTVEQAIVEKQADGSFVITSRVQLTCEVVEVVDQYRTRVRILEAGAGLAVDDEIVAPTAKLTA